MSTLYKFSQPTLPSTILHRTSLLYALQQALVDIEQPGEGKEARYKSIVLCAPAHYGKTTLLADLATHIPIPCCWYLLDASDANSSTFLLHLMQSIYQQFPHLRSAFQELYEQFALHTGIISPNSLDALINAFITCIKETISTPFLLCLCNYHKVQHNRIIDHIVHILVQQAAHRYMLVLESRPLAGQEKTFLTLSEQKQIYWLGSDELQLTYEDFLQATDQYQLSPTGADRQKALTALFRRGTSSFGTALLQEKEVLLPTLWQGAFQEERVGNQHPQERFLTYLEREVFQDNARAYTFLEETSLLTSLTPELCNDLLAIQRAEVYLNAIQQRGLLISNDDGTAPAIYRVHPFLRQLLYQRFRQHQRERSRSLHERAAHLFAAREIFESAIEHALAAEDYELATELVIKVSRKMLSERKAEKLAQWLDRLPVTGAQNAGWLLLLRAKIHLLKEEHPQATTFLKAVSAHLKKHKGNRLLQSDFCLAYGSALLQQGNHHQARRLFQQALKWMPATERDLLVTGYQLLGNCMNEQGNVRAGIANLQQALLIWNSDTRNAQVADLHRNLANVYDMIGNQQLADHHFLHARTLSTPLEHPEYILQDISCEVQIQWNRGNFNQLEEKLTKMREMASELNLQRSEGYALVMLAMFYQNCQCFAKALTVTETCLALAKRVNDPSLLSIALATLAMTYFRLDDPYTALILLEKTSKESEGVTHWKEAICELLRGTVFFLLGHYSQAYVCLQAATSFFAQAHMKPLQIRATLRLAACQQALGYEKAVAHLLKKVTKLVTSAQEEQLLLHELPYFPHISHVMQYQQGDVLTQWYQDHAHQPHAPSETGDLHSFQRAVAERGKEIRVLAFGDSSVFLNGSPVHWRISRSMELFFFLLNHGRPIHKEQLIDTLWPSSDTNPDQLLRTSIHFLRKAIGSSCVLSKAGKYSLDLTCLYEHRVWYDVAVFEQLYGKATHALSEGDDTAAQTYLLEMITLYTGDYLSTLYSNWCIIQRDRLRQMCLDMYRKLAQIAWRHEQFEESITFWQRLLSIDSCQEDAHYGIMRALLKQGKRGMALRQYQLCVSTLKEELNIVPGVELQRLYHRLTERASS